MSLKINGERLLAEALEDAMERDLADVPAREQLERQHRFSGKFVRRMKRIEKSFGKGSGPGRDFAALGRKARRFGGMAAALVCVIGLTVFLGVMGRMGASKDMAPTDMPADDMAEELPDVTFPEDNESADEPADDKADAPADEPADDSTDAPADEPADDSTDAPADEPVDDSAGAPADEPTDDGGEEDRGADFSEEPAAPGWQEQLLRESEEADALIAWRLSAVYDGRSFVLESELADTGEAPAQPVSVSMICEVYYEERAGEWVRVYRADRSMSRCEPYVVWGDEYFLRELNMTRSGAYRLVRQVNGYRQVLGLTISEWEE